MEFSLSEQEKNVQEHCRQFAQQFIAPSIKVLEDDITARKSLFQLMAKQGLFLLALPKENGGSDAGTIGYLLGLKEIAKADAGIAVAMAVTHMVCETVLRFGTKEQHQHIFQGVSSGSLAPLSFALTEKQAGSDVKAIETAFQDDPSDNSFIILNGEKQFITNADIAGALIVMAKGKFDGGASGISAFLIDNHIPGLSVTKKENKLGLLTANLVDLCFDHCRIPKSSLLGTPGDGLKIALSSLDSGRLGVAAQALGIAEAAFESALSYSKHRRQFGRAIGENQAIAFKLADMHVNLSAAQLLMCHAAWLKDHGLPFTAAAAEAKLFCSEKCNDIASDALQIHGGYGYIKDYPAEKYFRDARVTSIYEGTSEIQRIVISRSL